MNSRMLDEKIKRIEDEMKVEKIFYARDVYDPKNLEYRPLSEYWK